MQRGPQENRRRLYQTAAAQSGYFTSGQAKQAGYAYSQQHYHVSRGNWLRVGHGIFRLRNFPPGEREDLVRWSLWSRNQKGVPQAIVSHDTALTVHALSDVMPELVHLIVPSGFRKKVPPGCVLHIANLASKDIESRTGYQVTTPLRTLLDVADSPLSQEHIDKAVQDALERGLVRRRALVDAPCSPTARYRLDQAMAPTRRQFIKQFGVMLASLIIARCTPARTHQSNEQETPTPTNIPPTSTSPCTDSDKPHCTDWNRLRQCWLDMSDSRTHLATLEVLIEAGEIDPAVADQMQIAFTEATIHVGIERSGATCYADLPIEYEPRTNLVRQIGTLREIADDLDPVVVEKVQNAISRDIAFFGTWSALQTQELDREESIAKMQELILQFNSNTLQASPEAIEAAYILVKLVLGEIE